MGEKATMGSSLFSKELPMPATQTLEGFIGQLPKHQGFPVVTARNYAFDEAEYDAQYGYNPDTVSHLSASLSRLFRQIGAKPSGLCIDVGCGTGVLAAALAGTGLFSGVVFSDPSIPFLKICRAKVNENKLSCPEYYLAMAGDDLGRLPADLFSMVAVRYTLHHIMDWRQFLRDAHRVLAPGGILAIEEPFAEGFLLQAILIHFHQIKSDAPPHDGHAEKWFVDYLRNSVASYLLSDPDKARKEDKHLFLAHELMTEAQDSGYHFQFFPNSGFEAFTDDGVRKDRFVNSFLHNCRVNLGFPPELVERISREYKGLTGYLDPIERERDCIFSRGLFILRKPRP
jgi:ubiquinone/menaquinone biosynthesis C-methylase UbiE